MSIDDWHLVFVIVYIFSIFASCVPVITALLPMRQERFFSLAVLGEEGEAEHYFPDDISRIGQGSVLHWNIYLYNHMGEAQFVTLKVKLLNSTMIAPNLTTCTPSPEPSIYEIRRFLNNNETIIIPISWSISNIQQMGRYLNITTVYVNDTFINTNIIAINGLDYRIILELWTFDESLDEFKFGWGHGESAQCAWNQIWFDLDSNHLI